MWDWRVRWGKRAGRGEVGVRVVYAYAAWLTLMNFTTQFGLDAYNKTLFHDAIAGVAYKPFVYRALVPTLVRMVASLTPPAIQHKGQDFVTVCGLFPLGTKSPSYEFGLFAVLAWGCFFGMLLCLRRMIRLLYPEQSPLVGFLGPLAGLALLPLFYRYHNYIYDPATLFLWTAALTALATRQFTLYLCVFLLACVNKETAFLLVPVFTLFARGTLRGTTLAALCVAQLGCWAGIKQYITQSYADRPGPFVEFHLLDHNLPLLYRTPWAFLYVAVVGGLFALMIARSWASRPLVLRQSFLAVLIPMFVFLMLYGLIDEIRAFYEVWPFLILLSVPTMAEAFRWLRARLQAEALPAAPTA